MGVIYLRTNKINDKKYVGQATNLKERQRKWNCLSKKYAGPAINAARAKYGIEAFDFEILKECNDDELDYWEMYYIKELNTKAPYGYNLTDGGGGMSGYTLSEETRKKMSEKRKGENNSFYGKHHSEETKRKISEANKGKQSWSKGKHCSEETKRKMSESHLNGKCSKIVLQIDKETNEIIAEFPSVSEVKRMFNFNAGNIASCCRGICKQAYGFIWKYKESVA